MTVLHRRWKVMLCKGLCHSGRQRDGDAYRMQMGGDGDEWDCAYSHGYKSSVI